LPILLLDRDVVGDLVGAGVHYRRLHVHVVLHVAHEEYQTGRYGDLNRLEGVEALLGVQEGEDRHERDAEDPSGDASHDHEVVDELVFLLVLILSLPLLLMLEAEHFGFLLAAELYLLKVLLQRVDLTLELIRLDFLYLIQAGEVVHQSGRQLLQELLPLLQLAHLLLLEAEIILVGLQQDLLIILMDGLMYIDAEVDFLAELLLKELLTLLDKADDVIHAYEREEGHHLDVHVVDSEDEGDKAHVR